MCCTFNGTWSVSYCIGSEFWDASTTLKKLAEGSYFEDDDGATKYPPTLRSMIGELGSKQSYICQN